VRDEVRLAVPVDVCRADDVDARLGERNDALDDEAGR
jgi:hypothetical protein